MAKTSLGARMQAQRAHGSRRRGKRISQLYFARQLVMQTPITIHLPDGREAVLADTVVR